MADLQLMIEDLMELGYSEYEARVYLALLKKPEVSGYEVSKQSGVPRSKVYEVLEGLEAEGVVLAMSVDDTNLYRPIPHQALIQKHRQETISRLDRLQHRLRDMPQVDDEHSFFALTGGEMIDARVRELIESAEHTLFVSAWPEEFSRLSGSVDEARRRGVTSFFLVYDDTADSGRRKDKDTFYHTVTPMQYRQVEVIGRWLLVSVDNIEVVLGQFRPDEEVALCARNRGLAFLIAQTVAHDITAMEFYEALGSDGVWDILDEESRQVLRRVQGAAAFAGDNDSR